MVNYEESRFRPVCAESGEASDLFESGNNQNRNERADRQTKNAQVTLQGVAPQNRHIESVAQAFLAVHWDGVSPLLLGFSGGPDSTALLYALLASGVKPHLAHIDHGWREESADEATQLRALADELGLTFHTTRLDPAGKGNKEDLARKGRMAFFKSLFAKIPFQALLLGHQADDLAETVLKRIFEGAHLSNLGGMQPVSRQNGMLIWRPLLSVRREQIIDFVTDKNPLMDPTNSDPAYLRSRMRIEMIPYLTEVFGKEILDNLLLLAERTAELKHYLDEKIDPVKIHRGEWGLFVDLEPLHRLERRHLIQKICPLPRAAIETLLDWIEAKESGKQLVIGAKKIFTDRGALFFQDLKG